MARPLWAGSLSFGLVNVPVALFSATRDRDIHFQLLHAPDCSPIETRRVCAAEERPVPWPEIARGYELENGEWVLLSDEDLRAAAPRQSRTIDIERFVEVGEIDPVYFDHSYLLVPPDEGAARAYALLSETMGDSDRAALGRFVLRAKERLVCIRVRDGALTLTTMLFGDEVRSTAEIAEGIEGAAPTREQVDSAVAVIEELGVEFDPTVYRDEHRAHLKRIIKRKQQGKKIATPAAAKEPVTTTAPDLMGALEESLARIRAQGTGRGGKSRAKTGSGAAAKAKMPRADSRSASKKKTPAP
ncbi:MAG: Ku protein [Solirubrobacteraceae bacterium]